MNDLSLSAEGLTQLFGKTRLFVNLSFKVSAGDVLLIRGPNGSGKSTLIRILAGFIRPTSGDVTITTSKSTYSPRGLLHSIGMCTPEMRLYEELTGWENLLFFSGLRALPVKESALKEHLERLGLAGARQRQVGLYSSGMKQRLKLLVAALHEPPILYLDEPGSNLDEEGMAIVSGVIEEQQERGVVIMASNDTREFGYATGQVDLAV